MVANKGFGKNAGSNTKFKNKKYSKKNAPIVVIGAFFYCKKEEK